jgi:hypothetical protein
VERTAPCTFSPALPGKGVEDLLFTRQFLGPILYSMISFWTLDPLALFLFLVVVLVAAIGKGQSTNRHPRAIHFLFVHILSFCSF